MFFFTANHGWSKVKKVGRSYLNVSFFSLCPSLKVAAAGLLFEEAKQYLVLYDK